MSFFRRKLESKKTPDESSGAQASSRPGEEAGPAEERVSPPSGEQAADTEQAAPSRDGEKQGSAASEPAVLTREPNGESIALPAAAELVGLGELLSGRVNLIARTPDLRSAQMIFEIAVAGSSDWRALGTTRAPFHLSVDTSPLIDGSYELRIESVTAEGLSVYSKRFGPYIIDNTPPSITITRPAKGETLRGRVELVVEVADDASGLARVELSYSEEDEWITLAELKPEEGEVRGFWQTGECRPGKCQLRATAFDRAGNEASQVITVEIARSPSELEPEETPAPAIEPAGEPAHLLVLLPEAARRFGEVPSWNWQRSVTTRAESDGGVEDAPVELDKAAEQEEKPAQGSDRPESPVLEEGVAETKTEPEQPSLKGAAWSWKSAAHDSAEKRDGAEPRRGPELEAEAAPEGADEGEPKQESEEKSAPESKTEEKPGPKQEREPEERADLVGKEPVQNIRLAEPIQDEEQENAKQESEDKPKDSVAEESGSVVNVDFARAARGWDIWELSELVEETPGQDPARQEERRQILYHLREHTSVDGRIPPEFEGLIYDAFGELIPGSSGT